MRRPAGVSPQAYEQRFRRAVLEPNAQFALFRRGARVGTATVQANGPVSTCGVEVSWSAGFVELPLNSLPLAGSEVTLNESVSPSGSLPLRVTRRPLLSSSVVACWLVAFGGWFG